MTMLKKWGPLVLLLLAIGGAYLSGLHHYLDLETLQTHKESFQTYTQDHPVLSVLIFLVLYTSSVALSLPIATLLTLLGGFLFGKWVGTLLVVTAATLGATIIFLIAKSALGQTLREKAGGLYQRAQQNMKDNAIGYLLFMRLMPLFPFVLVNILPALFNVRLTTFLWTTFIGILPGSFVYVNLGESLGDIQSLGDLVSGQTLLAFGLLGFFALLPTLYKQFKRNRTAHVLLAFFLVPFLFSTQSQANETVFTKNYDALLKAYVTPSVYHDISYSGVDYESWSKDKHHNAALDALQKTDPDQYTGNAAKNFWINAYNFLTIDLIIRTEEKESIKNLGGFLGNPWKKYHWTIHGKDYTLDQIEHHILRPMGDARIHFAINCASVSCPDLRHEAYRAKDLNAQLDDQVQKTLKNTKKGIHKDTQNNHIHISKIFDWFDEDFQDGNVRTWLSTYKILVNDETEISYLPYDWSLNKKR